MPDFAAHLSHLLHLYTYPVLFSLVMVESLGIPLPGEIALVTAAAFASRGSISIVVVIVLAAIAASLGGVLGYWIGNRGGLALVGHYGGYLGVRKSHIDKAHAFFERNGAKTILFGRFIALLRTWASVIAGAACMSFRQFVLYNTLSSVVWSIVFGFLGYHFGRDLPALERYISHASLAIFVLCVIGVAVFLLVKRRSKLETEPGWRNR